ncbi:MAG: metallophosphoesterase [Cellulomonadaceae bacterium]|nr:metallophosphoesterase [Cellulomonadaceae bacterium]
MNKLGRGAVIAGAALAAGVAYAHLETKWFTVHRVSVPVLPAGSAPIKILQLADIHLLPTQRTKLRWLASLAALRPDLIVNTGDNLASPGAVPALLSAIEPLLRLPGVFVGGSNDYYAPRPRNAAKYLFGPSKTKTAELTELPWRKLFQGFEGAGWLNLNNARATVKLPGGREIAFVGTDDYHISRAAYPPPPDIEPEALTNTSAAPAVGDADEPCAPATPSGPATTSAAAACSPALGQQGLTIGVTHAPYSGVLQQYRDDGVGLVIAGHTHGGQLRIPGFGALVTNSDLARHQASGLSHWKDIWLHVSAGAGTSPWAPFRFACRPSATLLTLVPAPALNRTK